MTAPEDAYGADYRVHGLEEAISDIEVAAQSGSGREELEREAERLIDCQRRLYAVMWTLSLVVKHAA